MEGMPGHFLTGVSAPGSTISWDVNRGPQAFSILSVCSHCEQPASSSLRETHECNPLIVMYVFMQPNQDGIYVFCAGEDNEIIIGI